MDTKKDIPHYDNVKPDWWKMVLATFTAGLVLMPFNVIMAFMPFETEYVYYYGMYGLLMQAFAHFGIFLSKIVTPRLISRFGPRIVMFLGAMIALGFYFF